MTAISNAPGSAPLGLVTSEGHGQATDEIAAKGTAAANLAFFALALGVAGTLLGVTVVWFFAAIPLGLAAVVTGGLALSRPQIGRHRSRAVLGTVLGVVALLLGVLSAILLPVVFDRADRALTGVRDDFTGQIDKVTNSVAGDVDRVDLTITREMRELERQSRQELSQFQDASTAELRRLERRLAATERDLPAQNAELAQLGRQLRVELAALAASMNGADGAVQADLDAITTRVLALEDHLGLPQPQPQAQLEPQPAEPVAPEQTATG